MSQENFSVFCLDPIVQTNKYFVYNKQKIPIDFDLIKTYSLYFKKNQNDFEDKTDIEIAKEPEVSNDVFQVFVNCCQKEKIKITDSNVFALHYLSIKYEVPGLTKFTESYIEENHQKLVFQSLLFKQDNQQSTKYQFKNEHLEIFNASKEEEIISDHLNDYISDERLLSLQIPVIDRILAIYFKKNKDKSDQTEKKKICDFLIKYLKHHGKKASIIFTNIDLGNVSSELIIKLHNECKEIFDFNMINSESLFNTTYELLSELKNVKFEMLKIIQEYKEQLKLLNECKSSTNSQIDQINKETKKLKQNQDDFQSKQNSIIQKQNSMEENEKNLESKQNSIEEKQKNLESKQNSMEEEQKNLESKQNSIEEKQKNLESKQNLIEEKQKNLESKQNSIEEKQKNLESKQNPMEEKQQTISQLSNKQEELSRQLIQQQQKQNSFQESLDQINKKNSEFATKEI